jgi:hypothetical protein
VNESGHQSGHQSVTPTGAPTGKPAQEEQDKCPVQGQASADKVRHTTSDANTHDTDTEHGNVTSPSSDLYVLHSPNPLYITQHAAYMHIAHVHNACVGET